MDEDLEFRDMVLKKMEENGSLLGIKANLRALLYDIIENEQPGTAEQTTDESNLSSGTFENDSEHQLDDKSLAYELMLDALGSLNLHFTKKILLAETGHHSKSPNRERLLRQLGFKTNDLSDIPQGQSVLVSLIKKMRGEAVDSSNAVDFSTTSQEEDHGGTRNDPA